MREREFGAYDQDRYGYGRQDRYGRGGAFGGDYDRGDYGRDYDRGRDYDYGRGGGVDRERRFGGERGYSRGQGWRADEHPGYARNAYRPEPRSFSERSRGEVGSWFGDEDAMRRRQQDEIRDRDRWGGGRQDADRIRRESVRRDCATDFDRARHVGPARRAPLRRAGRSMAARRRRALGARLGLARIEPRLVSGRTGLAFLAHRCLEKLTRRWRSATPKTPHLRPT